MIFFADNLTLVCCKICRQFNRGNDVLYLQYIMKSQPRQPPPTLQFRPFEGLSGLSRVHRGSYKIDSPPTISSLDTDIVKLVNSQSQILIFLSVRFCTPLHPHTFNLHIYILKQLVFSAYMHNFNCNRVLISIHKEEIISIANCLLFFRCSMKIYRNPIFFFDISCSISFVKIVRFIAHPLSFFTFQ